MRKGLIILIVLAVLVLIIGIYYFSFVYLSESKAKEIIRQDFYKDRQKVCNIFLVSNFLGLNDEYCQTFANCYLEKAIYEIPKELLVPIAKDIKYKNSSALHSFEIIDGKQIGANCLSEIQNTINQQSEAITTPQNIGSCSDNDGGKDYFKKGQLTIETSVGPLDKTDYCVSSEPRVGDCTKSDNYDCIVIEYYCDGDGSLGSERHTCLGGCQDGACT